MNDTDKARFDAALSAWLKVAQDIVDADHARMGFTAFPPGKVSVDPGGKKYLRIVKTDGASRSAHSFIDLANGDVLKPDGWKRPAKGARGNIFDAGRPGVSAYGALYLR